jgi:hypothetical protein
LSQRPKHIKKSNDFPVLTKRNHSVESDWNPAYNCIAFAADVTHIKWWPAFSKDAFWPPGAPYSETLESFIKAFNTIGYVECNDGDYVEGIERIALYTHDGTRGGRPKHAAKQIDSMLWASKLGNSYDIKHHRVAVSGGLYGRIAAYMSREKKV